MGAKQSSTATGMYSCTGSFAPPTTLASPTAVRTEHLRDTTGHTAARSCRTQAGPESPANTAGLLHDLRNLMGTVGLYCDLLSMPGVLQPEHRPYADDLRLVGRRSEALLERLAEQLRLSDADGMACDGAATDRRERSKPLPAATARAGRSNPQEHATRPVSLRGVVERCAGLLRQVAGGREVEISYGEAGAAPVLVAEESVERILVNLVRNAAAALEKGPPGEPGESRGKGTIRIGVGNLATRVGEQKAWPFRKVRLTVEDSGCGMTAAELAALFAVDTVPAWKEHGVGFRVVRDLIRSSRGDLRVESAPGVGTRVEIEWAMVLPDADRAPQRGAHSAGALQLLAPQPVDAQPRERTITGAAPARPEGKGWTTC